MEEVKREGGFSWWRAWRIARNIMPAANPWALNNSADRHYECEKISLRASSQWHWTIIHTCIIWEIKVSVKNNKRKFNTFDTLVKNIIKIHRVCRNLLYIINRINNHNNWRVCILVGRLHARIKFHDVRVE